MVVHLLPLPNNNIDPRRKTFRFLLEKFFERVVYLYITELPYYLHSGSKAPLMLNASQLNLEKFIQIYNQGLSDFCVYL
jgi:hypothetical protein